MLLQCCVPLERCCRDFQAGILWTNCFGAAAFLASPNKDAPGRTTDTICRTTMEHTPPMNRWSLCKAHLRRFVGPEAEAEADQPTPLSTSKSPSRPMPLSYDLAQSKPSEFTPPTGASLHDQGTSAAGLSRHVPSNSKLVDNPYDEYFRGE